jgi:hypothetical protein
VLIHAVQEEMEPRAAGISDEEGFMRYQMEVTEGLRRIEEEVRTCAGKGR